MGDYTSVLLVVPASDLKYARSERSNWDAARNMRVDEVPAPVTIESVTRALGAGQYEGVAILGHGAPEGISLDNGELLDYETLAPFVRGRLRWMYLGVCDSEELAQKLMRDWAMPIVYTVGKVYDKVAYSTGTSLAYQLDEGKSFEEAAALAVGQSRSFRLVTPQNPYIAPTPAIEAGEPFRYIHVVPA